jgi:hypothetical protein
MSLLSELHDARVQLDPHREDPWRKKVEAGVRDKDAISTAALLDLLRMPATTGTARRLATIMRELDFIPIKSRRLMPGGHAGNTVTRGWARPIRQMKPSPTMKNAGGASLNSGGYAR